MIDIDWSKAPEGATHYEPGYDDHECAWVRVDENGDRHYWFKGMWLNAELTGDEIGPVDSMIPRPTKTEWVDGLPDAYACPAGCGCLWRDNGDDTMSLYGPKSQSCDVCEMEPLKRMVPVKFLQKPEQRQREELAEIIAERVTVQCGTMMDDWQYDLIADAILSKYNLTEK